MDERLAERFNFVELWPGDLDTARTRFLRSLIIQASLQPHINHPDTTPRDARDRFRSHESFLLWASKAPKTLLTLSRGDQLGGLIWFGESEREDVSATHTYAGRLYEGSVGQGLATPFMHLAHDLVAAECDITDVWLEVNTTNAPARAAYERFGYSYASEQDNPDVRLLMEYHRGNETE